MNPAPPPPVPGPANARDAPPAVPDDGYDSDGMTELVYKPTDLAAPHLSSQSSPAVDSVVNRMAYSVSRGNPRKAWRLMDESPVMDLSDPATAAAVADLHPQDDEPDLDALTDVPGVVPFLPHPAAHLRRRDRQAAVRPRGGHGRRADRGARRARRVRPR